MISLDELREFLNADIEESHVLDLLEQAAVAFVEAEFDHYFGPVAATTEVLRGEGIDRLILSEIPSAIPATVTESAYVGATPVTITAANDDGYVLRSAAKYRAALTRKNGHIWHRGYEYSVTYSRGYAAGSEPQQIRQLVRDLVMLKWNERDAAGGVFRSESIGPYTYTLGDLSMVAEQGAIPLASLRTHWRGMVYA